jgi:hypothetical protein
MSNRKWAGDIKPLAHRGHHELGARAIPVGHCVVIVLSLM